MPLKFNLVRNAETEDALVSFTAARLHSISINRVITAGAALHGRLTDADRKPFPDYGAWARYSDVPRNVPQETALRQLIEASEAPDFEKKMLLESPVLLAIASHMNLYGPSALSSDPYYRNVRLTARMAEQAGFRHRTGTFGPCEFALYDAPTFLAYGLELPCVGMFTDTVSFPIIGRTDADWTSVTPIEINTIRPYAEKARGRVLCCGLGLGYYAFTAHMRPEVESVTIVEPDPGVVRLFGSGMLQQFPHPDKITVINADPLNYLKATADGDFNTIFVSGWKDYSSVDEYLLAMAATRHLSRPKIDFWIEDAILADLFKPIAARILSQVLEWDGSPADKFTGIDKMAQDWEKASLPVKRAVRAVCTAMGDTPVDSEEALKGLFTTGFLRDIVRSDRFVYKSPYGR